MRTSPTPRSRYDNRCRAYYCCGGNLGATLRAGEWVVSQQSDITTVTAVPAAWWQSAAVPPFRSVAAPFIEVIRDRENYSASDLLHRVHSLLAELYVAGFALPIRPESAYDEDDDDEIELPPTDPVVREQRHARWRSIYVALGEQIGSREQLSGGLRSLR